MGMLAVVYVRDNSSWPIRHGGVGCGEVVNKQADDNFGCGLCKGHLVVANTEWWEVV